MSYIIKTYKDLQYHTSFNEGDYAYATDTDEYFIYTDGALKLLNPENFPKGELNLNLYDLNKQAVGQLSELPQECKDIAIANINNWIVETANKYYMLYGKEKSYFTIFSIDDDRTSESYSDIGFAVIDCLSHVGTVVSIELTENNDAFEIWVKDNNEATVLYLFPYDSGIVHIWR